MDKRTYSTLDGVRGVAAVLIVIRHTPQFWGGFAPTDSFLAVDLFFALSGFVLAHAYGARLDQGMGARAFMRGRLIRLYPLYFLGAVAGLVAAPFQISTGHGALRWSGLPWAAAFAMVGLPCLVGSPKLYPLNGAHWSLFFEVLANLFMAAFWRRLSDRALATLCAVSGGALAVLVFRFGTADLGYQWVTLAGGFARVGFSFFIGILLYRRRRALRSFLPPFPCLALAGAALVYSPPAAWRPCYDLAMIAAGFPLLISQAALVELRAGARLFQFLGLTSYAIYALHYPAQRLVRGALSLIHLDVARYAPWSGCVFLALMLLGCWALDRFYDAPSRRLLAGRWRSAPSAAPVPVVTE